MYTKNVKVVVKDEKTMTLKNSLTAIRQLDVYKATKVIEELKRVCDTYDSNVLKNRVIVFDYNHTPTQTISCWAKVLDVFPPHNIREFIPTNVENTSPRLTSRLQIKFL